MKKQSAMSTIFECIVDAVSNQGVSKLTHALLLPKSTYEAVSETTGHVHIDRLYGFQVKTSTNYLNISFEPFEPLPPDA